MLENDVLGHEIKNLSSHTLSRDEPVWRSPIFLVVCFQVGTKSCQEWQYHRNSELQSSIAKCFTLAVVCTIGLLQQTITWYKIRHAGGQAHYYSRTGTLKQRPVKLDWLRSLFLCLSAGIIMSLPSSMADFVSCDRLLQKGYCLVPALLFPRPSRSIDSIDHTRTNIDHLVLGIVKHPNLFIKYFLSTLRQSEKFKNATFTDPFDLYGGPAFS